LLLSGALRIIHIFGGSDVLNIRNTGKLLRLRGEDGTLRRELESQKAQLERQLASIPSADRNATMRPYIPKEQLANGGFATPEAALQTSFLRCLQENTIWLWPGCLQKCRKRLIIRV